MQIAHSPKASPDALPGPPEIKHQALSLQLPIPGQIGADPDRLAAMPSLSSLIALSTLAACGGGGGGGASPASVDATASTTNDASAGAVNQAATAVNLTAAGAEPAQPTVTARPSALNAARFLTQASFGAKSVEEVEALRVEGLAHWLWAQFEAPTQLHTSYLDSQKKPRKRRQSH